MVASVDIITPNVADLSHIQAQQVSQVLYSSLKDPDSNGVKFETSGAGQAVTLPEVIGTPFVKFTKTTNYGDVETDQCKDTTLRSYEVP